MVLVNYPEVRCNIRGLVITFSLKQALQHDRAGPVTEDYVCLLCAASPSLRTLIPWTSTSLR